MKVSHTKLENARKNPSGFKKQEASGAGFFRLGQYRYWQFATRHYHDNGRDDAFDYLERSFEEKFANNARNRKKLEEFQYKLDNYIKDFEELGNINIRRGVNISMDLGYSNTLSGEIAREDMKLDGRFEIFLFIKEEFNWEDELRFPLLQAHYAQTYGVSYSYISVGVYSFENDQHISNVYSDVEVNSALNEVQNISRIISAS